MGEIESPNFMDIISCRGIYKTHLWFGLLVIVRDAYVCNYKIGSARSSAEIGSTLCSLDWDHRTGIQKGKMHDLLIIWI